MKKERKPLGIVRCVALDGRGRRCPRTSVTAVDYHGNNELYDSFSGKPVWVAALMCRKHADKMR